MARQNGQKTKLLFLYKLLLERGDEDNPISTPELIEALAARDIPAERKSIYRDMISGSTSLYCPFPYPGSKDRLIISGAVLSI